MADPSRPIRVRRRTVFSCEGCRRRKIKCDRTHPCRGCRQSDVICSYPEGAAPLHCHITPVASAEDTTELPAPTSIIPIASLPLSNLPISGIRDEYPQWPPHRSWKSPDNSNESSDDSPKVRALVEKVQRLEQLLSEYMPDEVVGESNRPVSVESRVQLRGTLSKTRYLGPTHWMNTANLFDTIAATRDAASTLTPGFNNAIMMTNVPVLMSKCKAMAKESKIRIYEEWLANQDFRASIPSSETCETLLDAYFRTSESTFRIFHIPTFRKEYDQYRNQPFLASDNFILRMLLAMAIGVTFYQEPNVETLRIQAKKWVYAAQSWLSETPYEKSRLNVSGLQLHCLLLIARQSLTMVEDLVWISTGSLLRRAFSIGLHRDPKYFSNMTVLQAETRRRLWATIIELNVQFSLEAGMNPLICFDDFDTEPPANINDEDIDENTSTSPTTKPSSVFTQTSIQIILLSSLKTRVEILKVCNSLNTEPSYEGVSRLGEIMMEECRKSSSFVRNIQSQNVNLRPTQLHCNMLDIYLRRFILVLYCFFATKPQDDPRQYYCRKMCLDSSMKIVNYASNESGSKQSLKDLPYDDYTCLKIRSGGFFESVVLRSIIIIFFELIAQLKEQDSFIEQTKEFRQPLKNVLNDACDLLAVRVLVAENNVKGHILFSAALGQIEAIESGKSPYQGAVEGAKKSAEICFEVLADKISMLASESENVLQGEMDFGIQDWIMDFAMPDTWLFSGWDGGQQ